MNVLDLFSGIGGFAIGLERAGMRTAQFCEIDPFCRSVLGRWWPSVPCHNDVRTLGAVAVDVVAAGFPCQGAHRLRVKSLGNTIVPAIAEAIGGSIMRAAA